MSGRAQAHAAERALGGAEIIPLRPVGPLDPVEPAPVPEEHHLGDRLAAFIDGELDHESRDRVQAHLATCPDCLEEADEHRRLKALLGGGAAPALSLAFTDRLLAIASGAPGEHDGGDDADGGSAGRSARRGERSERSANRPPRERGNLRGVDRGDRGEGAIRSLAGRSPARTQDQARARSTAASAGAGAGTGGGLAGAFGSGGLGRGSFGRSSLLGSGSLLGAGRFGSGALGADRPLRGVDPRAERDSGADPAVSDHDDEPPLAAAASPGDAAGDAAGGAGDGRGAHGGPEGRAERSARPASGPAVQPPPAWGRRFAFVAAGAFSVAAVALSGALSGVGVGPTPTRTTVDEPYGNVSNVSPVADTRGEVQAGLLGPGPSGSGVQGGASAQASYGAPTVVEAPLQSPTPRTALPVGVPRTAATGGR